MTVNPVVGFGSIGYLLQNWIQVELHLSFGHTVPLLLIDSVRGQGGLCLAWRLIHRKRFQMKSNCSPLIASLLALISVACSGSGAANVTGALGGQSSQLAGTTSNGGTSSGGESAVSGGSSAVTDTLGTAGALSAGGTTGAPNVATGGNLANGGVAATGGTAKSAAGGASNTTGGKAGTGGKPATGGIATSGGTPAIGGTKSTGGSVATGGRIAAGGTSAASTGAQTANCGGTGGSDSCPEGVPAMCGMLAALNAVRAAAPNANPPIPPLVWDCTLAATAQTWADTCPTGHDTTVLDAKGWGENIFWTSSSKVASPADAVNAWASEGPPNYDYSTNYCYGALYTTSNFQCGHYTQMVWRATTNVGCGYKTGCTGSYAQPWVCDFSPAGNVYNAKTSTFNLPY